MTVADHPDFDHHEEVLVLDEPGARWAGIIAIHSTALGVAAGGCRRTSYATAEAAMADALRLSRGMSFKNAMADLATGGGKAVIYRSDPDLPREQLFEEFGSAVERLGGRYITAEDVGTTVDDMRAVARSTRFVAGLPSTGVRAGGDPSPWTALGVFEALRVAVRGGLAGKRIAVQGLGSVGFRLCQRLHEAGARLVVADVNRDRVLEAQRAFGAEVTSVETIHAAVADVFSPNALGAVLDARTIAELAAPVVCGGANNQLATPDDGDRLFARGVLYVPDYVANAGGIINVMAEHRGEAADEVERRVYAIGPRVRVLLELARERNAPTHLVADDLAREKLRRAAHHELTA